MPSLPANLEQELIEAFVSLSALVDGGWEDQTSPGAWVAEEPIGGDVLRLAVGAGGRRLSSQAHQFELVVGGGRQAQR